MVDFKQMLQMGQKMQTQMNELQDKLAKKTVSSSSGGGMVTATVDGRGQVREIEIDPTVVDSDDVEMLEDLVLAAVSEAQQRAREAYEEELKGLTGGMSLPFSLPNFS